MRFLGSKYANNAFADPTGGAYSAPPDLAGKGEWGPGMAPTRKGEPWEGKGEGRGEGKIVATRCQILRLKCEDALYKMY